MKKILIICTVIFTTFTLHTFGQDNASKVRKVDRLESQAERKQKQIDRVQNEIDEQQKEVDEAQAAVDAEVERQAEIGRRNPKSHGTMTRLQGLREELAKEQEKLNRLKDQKKRLEKEKEEINEKLKKAREELEEALAAAEKEVFEEEPFPEEKDALKDYRKKVEGWNGPNWRTKFGKKLKARILEKIDKLLGIDDDTSLPQKGQQHFAPSGTLNAGWEPVKAGDKTLIYLGGGFYTLPAAKIEQQLLDDFQEEAYSNPETYMAIREMLGGEFSFGTFSTPARLEQESINSEMRLLLQFARLFKEAYAAGMGMEYSGYTHHAFFPVQVFETADGTTGTRRGEITQRLSSLTLQPFVGWMPEKATFNPYVKAGPVFRINQNGETRVVLGDWNREIAPKNTSLEIGGSLEAGVTWKINHTIRILLATRGECRSGNFQAGGLLAAGVSF